MIDLFENAFAWFSTFLTGRVLAALASALVLGLAAVVLAGLLFACRLVLS